jgi:lipopolysaccharide export system protein LptA
MMMVGFGGVTGAAAARVDLAGIEALREPASPAASAEAPAPPRERLTPGPGPPGAVTAAPIEAPIPAPEPPGPRPFAPTESLSRSPKAVVAPIASKGIPFPSDDEPLVKTSSIAATPVTTAPPARLPHPLAADELAPKPPEKKGAAFAVPAAAGDLLIAANSQTDFQVKDRRIVFTGNIVMKNERFYLTADMLVAYMKQNEGGLDFAEARGNVVVRMVSNGQETGSSGLSKTAVFHPNTGEIVLRGWPQVRFGNKAHIASSATTEMSLFTDGRMKTTGRNQTMIVRPPGE